VFPSELNPTQPNPTQPNPTSRFKGRLTSATTDCFTPTQRTGGENVGDFLNKIGRVPLLTGEEEINLAKKIQAGCEILQGLRQQIVSILDSEDKAIENSGFTDLYALYSKLPIDDRKSLLSIEQAEIVQAAKQAHERMVSANLRLVVFIAKKYQNRDLDLPDLIQEGTLGLGRAVDKFDHRRGNKLSTYAYWWIQQAITRAIKEKSRMIRRPVSTTEMLNRIGTAKRELTTTLKRTPNLDEIAALLNSKKKSTQVDITVEQLSGALTVDNQRNASSLDIPVGQDGNSDLLETIRDPNVDGEQTFNEIDRAIAFEHIATALASLGLEEQKVLTLTFGLGGEEPHTQPQIVNRMGNVTLGQVKSLKERALTKLRQNPNLGGFLA
jgi:RNA polymerase nonessential primary-like sigma factor